MAHLRVVLLCVWETYHSLTMVVLCLKWFQIFFLGFKVLIIKECHSFNAEAWDELLGMVEREHGCRVVFVLITVDANMVPTNISSRCQKFCFPKLKKEEMTLKLAKIVACEGIRIDKEEAIIAKAKGSLREAANLLDQLALLGSTITSSMVQQLV
ncbi:Protein STICHEL [Camellia lanceoleosa]|nr:Protein STICHEL [Camellia lanceoleosa]